MSPPSLLKRHKQFLGPAFVILEAIMHVYLAIYLTFHWTNWSIWTFTFFEAAMFIYLLLNRETDNYRHHHLPKTDWTMPRCEHGHWVADDCRICDPV